MTTTREAEALLFTNASAVCPKGHKPETSTTVDKPDRRRIAATYCPTCGGWVEVRLRPVRLHCTGCGIEARP